MTFILAANLLLIILNGINAYSTNENMPFFEPICGLSPFPPHLPNDTSNFGKILVARPHSWPWAAFLCLKDDVDPSRCDEDGFGVVQFHAIVIGKRWILSVYPAPFKTYYDKYLIILGAHNWRNLNGPHVKRMNISNAHYLDPDLSFLSVVIYELEKPISFDVHIQPICLPYSDPTNAPAPVADEKIIREGRPAWVVGWDWDFNETTPSKREDRLSQMYVRTVYGKRHRHERHSFIWAYTALRKHNFHISSALIRRSGNGHTFLAGLMLFDKNWMEYQKERSMAKFYILTEVCQWIKDATKNEVKCILP